MNASQMGQNQLTQEAGMKRMKIEHRQPDKENRPNRIIKAKLPNNVHNQHQTVGPHIGSTVAARCADTLAECRY